MPLISIRNLSKIFGPNPKRALPLLAKGLSKSEILAKTGCTVAINGASFDIEKRETFVVMGLSGSGKSTMIRCLNRLIEPTAGEILFDGKDIMQLDREALRNLRRYKMSMVFQHFGLLPHRSVLDNVEFGLEIGGLDKATRTEKAMNAIELVGLKGFEQSRPSELSGGMQQRVGLARALANDPEVLLMDEAFSALDPLIRTQMQDELIDLQARMHRTIVFITHDLDEALKLGDRIAILGPEGRVQQIGTPEEILCDPADDYVRAFVQNVDRTKVITASAIMQKHATVTIPKDGPGTATRLMEKKRTDVVFVTDTDRKLMGIVTIDDAARLARRNQRDLTPVISDRVFTTTPDTAISDLLDTAVTSRYPIAVIDEDRVLLGVVDHGAVLAEVRVGVDDEAAPVRLSDIENATVDPDATFPEAGSDQAAGAVNLHKQTEEAVS
ncbi:glycine betaine/L-proline ABC transporter ATP-binding protein [Desulfoprunum benzoelyticum]|uniref:Glycine betaine/proline transport system ATP-binding protein n=1 Tax=Desulfoprunum benzoelyticum TaxID=1506996 RepID=A0A840UUU3_9BACT|nr:glycine betaine/L-proline ABC transporter ATP-binding protein [Desulfoprunum benzoelyticum]MBB5347174.1 glycine betaine/proline transport system ATP-binding protein [Desulfoprunum benzoelyticum]MBM9530500.1 glycine betaine/L-proline ABC transporter ATP-binding protein [Desulfoprunum benzoelyticum]